MPPGTPQYQIPKNLGYTGDNEAPYYATGAVTLTENKPIIAYAVSGSVTLTLAAPEVWPNGRTKIYVVSAASTPNLTINDAAGNDLIGDTLTAVGDYAIIENVGGLKVVVIKEVST